MRNKTKTKRKEMKEDHLVPGLCLATRWLLNRSQIPKIQITYRLSPGQGKDAKSEGKHVKGEEMLDSHLEESFGNHRSIKDSMINLTLFFYNEIISEAGILPITVLFALVAYAFVAAFFYNLDG